MKTLSEAVLVLALLTALSSARVTRASANDAGEPGEAAVRAHSSSSLMSEAKATAPGLAPDRWPDLPAEALATAQASLDTLLQHFPGSDEAGEAAYLRGLILMHPSNRKGSLESARAAFLDVVRSAPDRDLAARALYAASTCRLLQGARAVSAAEDVRLVTLYGGSSAAPEARIRLARSAAMLGEPTIAAPLLDPLLTSDVRAGGAAAPAAASNAPRSGASSPGTAAPKDANSAASGPSLRDRAVNARALVERSSRDKAGVLPARPLDRTFHEPAAPVEIAALEVDSRGWLWKLDDGSNAVAPVTGGGRATPPNPAGERLRGFALDSQDRIYLWDDKGIVLPSGRRFTPEVPASQPDHAGPVRRIGGLAVSPRNDLIVIDASADRVLRYGMDLGFRDVVASFESRPTAVRCGEDGTIWVLLGGAKQIVTVAPTGERGVLALGGAPSAIESPAALSLDGLGRPHVLDAATRSIQVLDAKGRPVATIGALPTNEALRESPDRLRAPTAFAIDPAGRVYVADRKRGRIVRFQ